MTDHGSMPIPKFPLDTDQIVGRFWAVGSEPGQHSDGVCRVHDRTIEVDVVKPLTPWMTPLDGVALGVQVPAHEVDDGVVHGNLPISPGAVSFLGVRTVARQSSFFPKSGDVPELHRMRADWCIAGAHVEGLDTRYTGVRARFTHLELWAQTPGVTMTQQVKPALKSTYLYEPPAGVEVPFSPFEQEAVLRLATVATLGMPNVWGTQIATSNWLELKALDGWSLEELLARFVVPVKVLLTLLAGEQCDITHLEVQVGGKWCPVYGHDVKPDASRPSDESLLLGRTAMPLDIVPTWCETVVRLSPAPHVVASSMAASFSTLPSEALALTTAAEGIDRALNPDSRRFTVEEVDASVAALNDSDVPEAVRAAMVDALTLYFYEDSYPTRMRRLADAVADVAPGCIGKANKWVAEMRSLRVGLAHAFEQDSNDDALWQMHARVQSLRWALALGILMEAGVPKSTLTDALGASERYRRAERWWHRLMPKAHPPGMAGPSSP